MSPTGLQVGGSSSAGPRRSPDGRLRPLAQSAWSDSVFSPSARWPARYRADEEVGVVATGALFPFRVTQFDHGPQQIGAQHQFLRTQEVP